ncbi:MULTISPECIES: outer membrane protein assembly factor BamE domain-containing protein [unclassified Pseudomonas]|uniref:outer membrane protein assembly factor BamE domain-containing protein n=1 Tax=unclassified Pseudomonas TaxID=196821 RepID=UPI003FA24479
MKNLVFAVFVSLALSACVSGKRFTQEQVDQIKIGSTTEADIAAILGEPMSYQIESDGSRSVAWAWSYVAFAGVRSGSEVLTVSFGPDGKATKYGVARYKSPDFGLR